MIVPLSYQQRRIFFLAKLYPTSNVWTICFAHRYAGYLNLTCFEQALEYVLAKHSVLRSTIVESDSGDYQCLIDDYPLSHFWEFVDLTQLDAEESERRINEICSKELQNPLDLQRGPLLKCKVLKKNETEQVIVIVTHHIVSDAVSYTIVVNDLMSVYSQLAGHGECDGYPAVLQYSDYAFSQSMCDAELGPDLRYWVSKYQTSPPPLHLPTSHPRPPTPSHSGAEEQFCLDADLLAELNSYCLRHRIPLYEFLFAGFYLLLARYSGESDIAIGVHCAGRQRYGKDFSKAVGLFAGTLPVRIDLDLAELSVEEMVVEAHRALNEAYHHQSCPFEKIVEVANPTRDMSRHPLYQAEFNFINHHEQEQSNAFLGLTHVPHDMPKMVASQVDIGLHICSRSSGLRSSEVICFLIYATDLFTRSQVVRMSAHYRHVLQQMVHEPDSRCSAVSLLTDSEATQILSEFNDTGLEYSVSRLIPELVKDQAGLRPSQPALTCGSNQVTYQELLQRVNHWTGRFQALGIGPNTFVGTLLDPSIEMVVCLLAVLKAGAAYVPLDPDFPDERIAYMLADSQVSVLVTKRGLRPRVSWPSDKLIDVDCAHDICLEEPATRPESMARPDDVAYLVYTSGSTGRPKGTLIRHRALLNLLHGIQNVIDLTAGKRILCVTTFSFDIFVLESLIPLAIGMQVVIATQEQRRDPELLGRLIREQHVNVVQTTPSRMRLLVETAKDCLGDLDDIIVGGEAFPAELYQALRKGTQARIYNMYGPTETTVWSTAKQVTDADDITIGEPIANTTVYILDAQQRLLPIGIPGELCIGGDGLAIGYHNQEELTKARFIENPFEPGKRVYRSGDIAQWREDGQIIFVGRADSQLKIRGFRVELGEIETLLREVDGVADAAVTYESQNQSLSAFIQSDSSISTLLLRKHLRERVPEYMVPSRYQCLASFPRTSNGKIDRRALGQLATSRSNPPAEQSELSQEEQAVVSIVNDVLKAETLPLTSTFFDVGGHSLLALRVISRMEQEYRVSPDFGDFIYLTLGQFAARYGGRIRETGSV